MEPDSPVEYQQLFDTKPNRSHNYSAGSAVLVVGARLLLGLLKMLGLPAWIVRRRRGRPLRPAGAVWAFFLGKWLIDALEGAVDRRYARDIDRVQSERDRDASRPEGGSVTLARAVQPGELAASMPDRLMDRALGWSPALQAEQGGGFRPRCLFLRPFVPDNRFLCEIAPFTSADPEPISKFPRLETSCFRLVHGLGGDFVSSGRTEVAAGSPRLQLDADWQREIRQEIEAADLILLVPFYTQGTRWEVETVIEGGHLDKTLFLMPPSVLGRGMDERARGWAHGLLLFFLALKVSRGLGQAIDSDAVTFEYTVDRLRVTLRDPFLADDWEVARASFEGHGLTLPPHDQLGAVFSCEAPDRPLVRAQLATIYDGTDPIDPSVAELTERIRSFTALTGGNARSLLAAVKMSSGGYGHAAGVISAALDVLEARAAEAAGRKPEARTENA